MTSITLSVIMPVYNRFDLTIQAIQGLRQLTTAYEIIVVDDASESPHQLEALLTAGYIQKLVRHDENVGFSESCNHGAELAEGEYLLFLNNDVVVMGDFASEMITKAQREAVVGAQLFSHDTGWNRFGEVVVPYIAGWCLLLHHDLYELVQGFDTRYSPYDYEDMDLCFHLMTRGYKILEVPGPIHHLGGQSFVGIEGKRRAITETNRAKFAEKWKL